MSNNARYNEEISRLKKDVVELKSLFTEQYSHQTEINSDLRAKMDVTKRKVNLLSKANRKVKYLVDKFKTQKAQLDLLVTLMRGKFMDHHCPCGRKFNVLHVDQAVRSEEDTPENVTRQDTTPPIPTRSQTCQTERERFDDDETMEPMTNNFFSYLPDQHGRIGQIAPRYVRFGPVESLDENGEWKFQIADNSQEEWNQVYHRSNMDMASRLVLLPRELFGITVQFSVKRMLSGNNLDEIVIGLAAFSRRDDDERIQLPIGVTIRVDLKLDNGSIVNQKEKFVIAKMGLGYPAKETIRLSIKNCNKEKPPEMVFKFSK